MLHERTEGWPAALMLATLWLRRVPDLARAVREFGGDQRFVADYLCSEVIGSLDADIRPFVLRVSVLGRFTAELCDGVFGRSDSGSMLAELERPTFSWCGWSAAVGIASTRCSRSSPSCN